MGVAPILLTIGLVGSVACYGAEVVQCTPSQVVNLRDVMTRDIPEAAIHFGLTPPPVVDVGISRGTWAVLFQASSQWTLAAVGVEGAAHGLIVAGSFDRLVVDPDRHLQLLGRGERTVSVVATDGRVLDVYPLKAGPAVPLQTAEGAAWRGMSTLAGPRGSRAGGPADNSESNDSWPLSVCGALPSGGYYTFGGTLGNPRASRSGWVCGTQIRCRFRQSLSLDWGRRAQASYIDRAVAGDLGAGPERSSLHLSIGLTHQRTGVRRGGGSGDWKASGGHSADLPSVASEVSRVNPAGHITPALGAADDNLVIVDMRLGLLAVYGI